MIGNPSVLEEILPYLELDIPFRGTRVYLHSTHILAAILEKMPVETPIKLEFRKMILHSLVLSAAPLEAANRAGTFSFFHGDTWHTRGLYIRPELAVTKRVACNESTIISLYDTGLDSAEGVIGAPGTMIETIVALNKMIVTRNAPKGGKVVFSSVKLDGYPTAGNAGVCLARRLGETLFVSDVLWNGRKYGTLTFMVI